MEMEQIKPIIEAILFSSGRVVKVKELMAAFDLAGEDIDAIIQNMKAEFEMQNRGIEIISVEMPKEELSKLVTDAEHKEKSRVIKIEKGYQLCTKKEYYSYIYPLFDNRSKPALSNAAMETLSIIAYNPKITRSEIEQIRGVSSDGTIYRLLEYNLIEEAGKLDLPGKPIGYKTTEEFLKTFGISSLGELPELPKYKVDENEQIVIDEVIENDTTSISQNENEIDIEAPMPEREENNLKI